MPTGQKTIIWTAANDERLLLSILAVHNIRVDGPSVAKVFGNNIAPSVIQARMTKLKAKARALNPGVTPTDAVIAPSTTKRTRDTIKTNSGVANKKAKKEIIKDEEDDTDDLIGTQANAANDHAVTPPATPSKKDSNASANSTKLTTPSPKAGNGAVNGDVQPKRCSPRDSAKPNYRQMDDPFVYMEAGIGQDGTNVFGQGTDSESEDSVDSDKDFDAAEVSTQA